MSFPDSSIHDSTQRASECISYFVYSGPLLSGPYFDFILCFLAIGSNASRLRKTIYSQTVIGSIILIIYLLYLPF